MTTVDESQLLPTRKLGTGQRSAVWIADAVGGALHGVSPDPPIVWGPTP